MKKHDIYSILVVAVAFFLTGCESLKQGNGIVLDEQTNLPLSNLLVVSFVEEVDINNPKHSMTTDSTGKFNATTGIVGYKKNLKLFVVLSKDSFESQTVLNPENDTVRLVRK